jgi:hypothetical protein
MTIADRFDITALKMLFSDYRSQKLLLYQAILLVIFVEDIQLCLKYINKNELYMYSIWHNYVIFL